MNNFRYLRTKKIAPVTLASFGAISTIDNIRLGLFLYYQIVYGFATKKFWYIGEKYYERYHAISKYTQKMYEM